MSALTAREISLSADERLLLEHVSFHVACGELVGLIGPNGAGKSTLMRALAGLAPCQAGAVLCGDRPLSELAPAQRARLLGYLPQGAIPHWPLPVEAVVELGRLPHRRWWQATTAADRLAVERALGMADVHHLRGRPVTQLSGGERLRVLLARLFATDPLFILADEPVAALDPYHQLQIMELLRAHTRERQAGRGGVVVVLHDLNLAARFCDRLVLLANGRVAVTGAPREVLQPQWLRAVYGVEPRLLESDGEFAVVPWRRLPD
ncbi:MAG: ABC transporter ATP-binding protein [Spongiibacteraceae bacterium]|nr:ABC transporter ATP-binding protein [Spongiibacteraceae bacterium]